MKTDKDKQIIWAEKLNNGFSLMDLGYRDYIQLVYY